MVENNEKMYLELLDFDTDKKEKWVKQRLPYSVLFELTARCNMNCVHCYLQNVHDTKELSYDKIIEIIDILYEKGIVFLTFTGGEILLRKDFVDIYLYAKKKGFLVELFTNGYLFDDKIIDALAEYPPLLVDISLYGASENTYRKVTGLQNAFARVIQNCKKLKKAGIRVSLKSPIIDLTYPEIKDMQMLADKLQIPFVYTFEICNTIDRQDMPKMHQISLNKALEYEFANHYKQIQTEGRKSKSNYDEIINELRTNEKVYSCNVAVNSFVVDYNGKMCPCMKLRHRGIKLEKNNYEKIWSDFKKYSAQIATMDYKCKGCEALYYCDVCPAEMDFLYNDPEYRPENACKCAYIRKAFYENKISFDEALAEAKENEKIFLVLLQIRRLRMSRSSPILPMRRMVCLRYLTFQRDWTICLTVMMNTVVFVIFLKVMHQ